MSTWPEPVIPVQTLSDMATIPSQYIKPLQDRPHPPTLKHRITNDRNDFTTTIPVLNLTHVFSTDPCIRQHALAAVNNACREWGFFQIVDHGVSHQLMSNTLETWREFFKLPMELKQLHANSPVTYEGYGSRLGVEKQAVLDWCDYYFLHFYPYVVRDPKKWPIFPASSSSVLTEYGEALVELSRKLMKILSINLGLHEEHLLEALGEKSACLRANFYPKCPQPDLTLGLSPHSDPGGLTLLLADQNVGGLQIRKGDKWVTVNPLPNALIVNLGDQIQVSQHSRFT